MAEFGLFSYFTTFMETIEKFTNTITMSISDIVKNDSGILGGILDFLNIDLSDIPLSILNTPIALFAFGGALVTVLIWSIVKWILPLI